MRTYGRMIPNILYPTTYKWVEVDTDANGYNDAVYITTLIQVLKLNLNESPFWANYGIPAKPSVLQQVAPDYYVAMTQQQFSQYFASLIISRQPDTVDRQGHRAPTYAVHIVTNYGAKLSYTVYTEVPT